MTTSHETLTFERPGEHIGLVTLRRPGGFNALNTRMGEEGVQLFESFAMDAEGLRCLVLTGAGDKAFCAGGDLKERKGMSNQAWIRQHVIFERLMRALIDCPIPLIGAINGVAYGGGCEMAACCDFLYAAAHAKFALPEVRLGIMPGGGGTQTLPRAMGERRAKELLLTGRAFTAQEALAWGLVNEVVDGPDLLPRALETAAQIAANAPLSTRQVKQSAGRGLRMSLADGLAFEIEAYNRLVPTQDRLEGVLAFNEKRRPDFTGQ
jgi:enoyl-CoA hydratase/carnithine racemase